MLPKGPRRDPFTQYFKPTDPLADELVGQAGGGGSLGRFGQSSGGGGVASALFEPMVAVERAAEALGLSKAQLIETMGLSRETAYRPERLNAPKAQSRAREMLEIVARVADWAGGEQPALSWYRSYPIPAFGGRTAEALVKDGEASSVREYLDHVALGGFA